MNLLFDVHAHTQYAYCGDGVDARRNVEVSQRVGLAGISLTEHAGQLYCVPEDFWSARFLDEPRLIRSQRESGRDRMPAYLEEMQALRAESPHFVRLGIEVELNGQGEITLLEEDRCAFDLVLGAVHWLRDVKDTAPRSQRTHEFMKVTEGLICSGIHVLAHPFRYFYRNREGAPGELYRPVARLLADHGVAAEINFHTNEPEPEFFALCLEAGVRIAVGSDAHAPHEVGEFSRHLSLLRQIGTPEDLSTVLFDPRTMRDPKGRTTA